ncbi:MAG: homoserine kinase [Candidatus Limnocylindrales bacterium]|jgi:homoserine kinase
MSWTDRLAGRRLIVEVPATTANLGAGYDCLGLALEVVNRIEVEPLPGSGGGVELAVEGDGAAEIPADRSNRFLVALEKGLRRSGDELPAGLGWRLRMRNDVPLGRGLGSSATATVGGLVAANALLDRMLTVSDLLAMASEIEGHADNAAAALLGGFVVVDGRGDSPVALRFDAPVSLRCVLFIPERQLSTESMRACLPAQVPFAAAAANLGRVALGVAGLSQGRLEVLDRLTRDELHEPYRARLFPELPQLIAAAREAGALGACLSGAGSTVVAFSDSPGESDAIGLAMLACAERLGLPGGIRIVGVRNLPARAFEL